MPRAIVKNGRIKLLGPMPRDWQNGDELYVEALPRGGRKPSKKELARIDRFWDSVEELAARMPDDPEDDKRFMESIAEVRRQGKAQARRAMRRSQ